MCVCVCVCVCVFVCVCVCVCVCVSKIYKKRQNKTKVIYSEGAFFFINHNVPHFNIFLIKHFQGRYL